MIDWSQHEPHKFAPAKAPLEVSCKCGWHSKRYEGYAMDQYRLHVSSMMPKHEEITKPINTVQRTKRSRLR